MLEFIKRTNREEIYSIVFKVLVGVILATTIVYSIFRAGDAFLVLVHRLKNGYVFELIGFGILASAAFTSLYFLFQSSNRKSARRELSADGLPMLDYELIAIKFVEGFVEGLTSQTQDTRISSSKYN